MIQDARGRIKDILVGLPVDGVTLVETKAGAVRGNHFHRETVQHAYLLRGRMMIFTRRVDDQYETVLKHEMRPGELVTHEPLTAHAFMALEDSELLVLTHGPRRGSNYEQDTFRLSEDLRDLCG